MLREVAYSKWTLKWWSLDVRVKRLPATCRLNRNVATCQRPASLLRHNAGGTKIGLLLLLLLLVPSSTPGGGVQMQCTPQLLHPSSHHNAVRLTTTPTV